MITNVTLKLKTKSEIIWPLVLIEVVRLLGVSDQVTFILMSAWLILIFGKRKSIVICRIAGLMPLIIFLIYGTILGLASTEIRHLTRDLYYFVPTIVVMFIGFVAQKWYKDKSIEKTIMVIAAIIAVHAIVSTLMLGSEITNFEKLRDAIGSHAIENCYAFALIFGKKLVSKKIYFNQVVDIIIMILVMIQLTASFSRMSIVLELCVIASTFILSLFAGQQIFTASIRRLVIFLLLMVVLVVGVLNFFPNTVLDEYSDKWDYTSEEINIEQDFTSEKTVLSRWRAYEKYSSRKQWKESSALVELFGKGLGTGVKLEYQPAGWVLEEDSSIPILHNGYYMMLPKGGLYGVACLVIFYLSGLWLFFKKRKTCKNIISDLIVLATIGICMIVASDATSGMMAQSQSLVFGLLVGSINEKIQEEEENNGEKSEE